MKNNPSIYFYTASISNRLLYTLDVVFGQLSGIQVIPCTDLGQFKEINNPKINYSSLKIENAINITPHDLLFDREIKPYEVEYESYPTYSIIFPSKRCDLGFDIFASTFYILSRYEEYIAQDFDQHERYPAKQSILFKMACLRKPIIHIWTALLQTVLQKKFSSFVIKKPTYQFVPTYDIDMAWSYKEKGLLRHTLASIKNIIRGENRQLRERFDVLRKLKQDPFHTFDYLETQNNRINTKAVYFFLVAKHGHYDKNISPENIAFQKLIKKISGVATIGLHPSYNYEQSINTELNILENILASKIKKSRQHFIRLSFPKTYRLLLEQEIYEDYSMGYPDQIGFRNGIAIPTKWFDLEKDAVTKLTIHPFQVMDVSLKNYLKLSPSQAKEEIKEVIDQLKQNGGTFISIWHNSSFDHQWKDWVSVFEDMLTYAAE